MSTAEDGRDGGTTGGDSADTFVASAPLRGRSARVSALVRMRLVSFAASQRVLLPSLLCLALVFTAHAGGSAPAAEAYGFSAALLFGGLAWQTKVLLDTEPDGQRLIATALVGSAIREVVAGLCAAAGACVPIVAVAVCVPLLMGAVDVASLPLAVAHGIWMHTIAVIAATTVGAVASRAVLPRAGWAAVVLVGSAAAVLIVGSREAAAGWLVPRFSTAVRAAAEPGLMSEAVVTAHALVWSLAWLAIYTALRRRGC